MRIKPEIKMEETGKTLTGPEKARRSLAILLVFVTVFYFFCKLLFL